jgi:RimJ/RimL family protein N-acetyltransferase
MISGEHISLRPITAADIDTLEAWSADPAHDGEFNSFGLERSGHIERAFAEHGFLTEHHGILMISTRGGERAGTVSYRIVAHGPLWSSRAYQIGITVAPAHRGHGYGAEAQRMMATYLLATYPIERVEAETDVTNVAEQRALARAGFTREGTLRRAQFRNGAWHDLLLYSKLRGE